MILRKRGIDKPWGYWGDNEETKKPARCEAWFGHCPFWANFFIRNHSWCEWHAPEEYNGP